MCGIFGLIRTEDSTFEDASFKQALTSLFILSSSRGKEASGFAVYDKNNTITVHKTPDHPQDFIASKNFTDSFALEKIASVKAIIGHSRMVTNGSEYSNANNQPFIKNNITGVHNGIIVNEKEFWAKYPADKRMSDLDSEVIPTILRHQLNENKNLLQALAMLYKEIYGMASIALLFVDLENMVLATNNGSLYYSLSRSGKEIAFASENFIMRQMILQNRLENIFPTSTIVKIHPNEAYCINLQTLSIDKKGLAEISEIDSFTNVQTKASAVIKDASHPEQNYNSTIAPFHLPASFEKHYQHCKDRIMNLQRCTKCVLPQTFPGIQFDGAGVCNICNTYQSPVLKSESELIAIADKIRGNKNTPDCVVAFSGGRDSSYSLHYLKKLGLNPLAFSYDWGMVTDLARRNQSRICAKLGIEHILVSADIRKKRKNIRLNVSAWLKKPNLGTIPLFMAGDKQYFYYAEQIKKQNNLDTLFMGENYLEKTGFKTAFSGAKQDEGGFMAYHISPANKARMVSHYFQQYIANPAYLNSSIIDTAGAFLSYYWLPHQYINIFDFLKWDEQIINDTIIGEYDWELSPDAQTTWRIGDGTAPFYNYIYYIVAGFTENDTFRSNQIREGALTREKALALTERDNMPRWESIKWYGDVINIDWQKAIEIINRIPTLY